MFPGRIPRRLDKWRRWVGEWRLESSNLSSSVNEHGQELEDPLKIEDVSYWLIPSSPWREYLEHLIQDLAARYNCVPFSPHVTIAYGKLPRADAIRRLRKTAFVSSRITLNVDAVSYSPDFTKTFFISLRPSPSLFDLSRMLGDDIPWSVATYEPHLSLLYMDIGEQEQRKLQSNTKLPFTSLAFDEIECVLTPSPIEQPRDISNWSTLGRMSIDVQRYSNAVNRIPSPFHHP